MSQPDWDAVPPGQPPYGGPPPTGQPWAAPPGQQHPWGPPPQWGPPQTPPQTPPQWGPPQWGPAPWGAPPHPGQQAYAGQQPFTAWGGYAPPYARAPRRPGVVVGAAALAFGSALLTLVGTVYAMAFSALLAVTRGPSAGIGPWIALVQLLVVALFVVGGLTALSGGRREWLWAAAGGQVCLSVYWVVVLTGTSAPIGEAVVVLPVVYGALGIAAAGLTVLPDAVAWSRTAAAARRA
ncbi:hypothetical protein [Modestobacter roseus]|uniref:Uncharacterized protein n=1 Tax=Modestobacter roseus TaxID=1181884 RepID=A0A562INJ9_9ACTN|nr:hypothetical protein [Modestobacter roseus]MQA34995.1 hypothetical protein [Modestobacter roseus]TWH72426.1 hypothetical protein JD78_00937 [Modestobacter roseus]